MSHTIVEVFDEIDTNKLSSVIILLKFPQNFCPFFPIYVHASHV